MQAWVYPKWNENSLEGFVPQPPHWKVLTQGVTGSDLWLKKIIRVAAWMMNHSGTNEEVARSVGGCWNHPGSGDGVWDQGSGSGDILEADRLDVECEGQGIIKDDSQVCGLSN